jgi:hypothetical protein
MSNQPQAHDENGDAVVSDEYRELAQERTPAHLDHVVLNEARRAARNRPIRRVSWLRPAAWVTTIGLCLAIVLEVTDLVPQDTMIIDQPAALEQEEYRAAEPAAEQKRPDTPASEMVQGRSRIEAGVAPVEMASPGRSKVELEEEATGAPSTATLPSEILMKSRALESATLDAPAQNDMMMLRDAESRARAQEGTAREIIRPLSADVQLAAERADADAEAVRYCGPDETGSPDSWMECILRLQQDGRHDEARLEHDRLHETFPGAEIPPLTAPLPDPP